ncbi:MAG: putative bifunctional diguanylate cyclase/phosphodiesterase [Steroidobacteraceae bacterium]
MAAALCLCSAVPLAVFALAAQWRGSLEGAALAAALAAAACVWVASIDLSSRYVLPLRAVRDGLAAFKERRFVPPKVAARDEPRALLEALASTAASVQEQFYILEALAEIDQLLLGSVSLEQVLDAMLSRMQALTHCDGVGITLRDGDAPGRGRVYVAAAGRSGLPVSRVALDRDMLATLAAEPQGLTIARREEARHSFLAPLEDTGAEIFWVWPVTVAGRVEAILAAGFIEAPAAGPRLSRCGGELAARLGVALSRAARDERLYREAHYDPLTALPNRLLFRDHLSREIAGSTEGAFRGALLYIDLDHFKSVNDGFGHAVGDQLLTVVAQRLRACVKDGDLVARLGGDEFTIVLREVNDAMAAAGVAQRVAETLQQPVHIGSGEHHVSASIGVTLFPDDGQSLEDLVRNADTAMYRAKEAGRGRFMFLDSASLGPKPSAVSDTGLQRALRKREFSLFYQPQFAVADGTLAGLEALLRWHTPRDGMRQPDEFVPAAEESGLIMDIGGWVLDAACSQLAVWRDAGITLPRVAVNVCAQQVKDGEFSRGVRRALDKHALAPDLLELELTPSLLADGEAVASLSRLSEIGVRLVLGDFGTGRSSPGDLRQPAIGVVKIDRSLICRLPRDPDAAAIVATSISVAHMLGKRVVAQGVETIEQLNYLREHHCDLAQGFYLARPLSAAAVTELLRARVGANAVREAG